RLASGGLLELLRHRREGLEVLLDPLAAYPADESRLKARAQPPPPLLDVERRLIRRGGDRLRLLVRLQVEEEERALGQQRAAAHRPQVVEQRQQDERQIAPSRQHPLEIAR